MTAAASTTKGETASDTVKPEVEPAPIKSPSDEPESPYNSNSSDRLKTSSSVSHRQGYDYKGENSAVGHILALPSENFGNKVTFSTFVDKMKNYVLTKFEGGKDLLPILDFMKDPKPSVDAEEPTDLSKDDYQSEVKKWMKQEEVKLHIKRLQVLQRNQDKLYAIVWGQLSHALQEVIKGDDDFIFKDSSFDCVWVLQKAKLVSAGVDGKANKHYTFVLALTSFCTIQQGATESNDSFRKRVESSALTLGLAGGAHVFCSPKLVETENEDNVTETEVKVEVEKVKAMVMLLKADPVRYGTLQEDLCLSVYKGRDEFPTTLTATYDLLQHTSGKLGKVKTALSERLSKFKFRRKKNVTFVQSDKSAVAGKDGKMYDHITCHNCNTPGHYSNQCPAKKDKVTLAHFSLTQKKLELIDKNWILLDTCSTVSVFCNPDLVHNITDCKPGDGITVVTNGGSESFKQHGMMRLLPLRVHFNAQSIANIVSLSDIANLEGARLTMDTNIARAINLHINGTTIHFRECADGLYYYDTSDSNSSNHSNAMPVTPYSTSFVQTVTANKSLYSRRDIQGADRARELQQQLGWPSDNAFARIINDNLIHNSAVTIQDVQRALHIYGTATPLLQGKMVRASPTSVDVHTSPLPTHIIQQHPTLQLYVDFFYVNKIPFLHTKCSTFGYITAHGGVGRSLSVIKKLLNSVINMYESRGFQITDIHGDNEFDVKSLHEFLQPIVLHIYGREEHVAIIERSNRSTKERCRAICHSLPFKRYTRLMTLSLVDFVLYWTNAIPNTKDFASTSSATIVKGHSRPNFKYQHLAFGTYCMVYIGTKNNMKARSIPAISLAPSNQWGGHYFMSLISGKKVHGYKWNVLPIGDEVIHRVHELAVIENQPELVSGSVEFLWGNEATDATPNELEQVSPLPEEQSAVHYEHEGSGEVNNIDGRSAPTEQQDDGRNLSTDDIQLSAELTTPTLPHTDTDLEVRRTGNRQGEDEAFIIDDDNIEDELLNAMAQQIEDENDELLNNSDLDAEDEFFDNNDQELLDKIDGMENELTQQSFTDIPSLEDNEDDDMIDVVKDVIETESTSRPRRTNAGTGVTHFEPTWGGKEHLAYKKKCFLQQKGEERNTDKARITLLMKRYRKQAHSKVHLMQLAINQVFLSAQMSARKGIKEYGQRAIVAIIKECEQLDKGAFPDKPVVEPIYEHDLTPEEKEAAMNAVSLIKEKRCGKLKARICADGSKQKRYLAPEESVASPTSSNEGTIASFMIDAYERRMIAVLDIPGAYLHAGVKHDKRRVLLKLKGIFVDLMCKANPKYRKYVCYKKGEKVLYLKLLRALYGCIESALLWYELFTSKLKSMGFELNPYDKCVANKMVNGKQCTVLWYVDDVKISHVDKKVVESIVAALEEEFGSVNPTYGNDQEYLGMKFKIDDDRMLHIDMRDQVSEIIQDFSGNVNLSPSSPAARNLMNVNENSELLDKDKGDEFHSTVAKLLYLEKRGRPDLEPTIAFLSTRVSGPNENDWYKLERVMSFLNKTKGDIRTIGCDDIRKLYSWIDASFAVHNNMRSHTGGTMSYGWGIIHAKSSKQKLNTKSSTEAEVVGLSEYLPYNIWLINFMSAQGYPVIDNIVYQDNQSAIRMERNGRNSCTGNSRHIHIRYFFVKDRVDKKEVKIQYCPTAEMLADFFTKPLQGALFHKFRDVIMGWKHISTLKEPSNSELKERVEMSNEIYNNVSSDSEDKVKRGKRVRFKSTPENIESTNVIPEESLFDESVKAMTKNVKLYK